MGDLPGSKASPQAPAGLGRSGYDPGRGSDILRAWHEYKIAEAKTLLKIAAFNLTLMATTVLAGLVGLLAINL